MLRSQRQRVTVVPRSRGHRGRVVATTLALIGSFLGAGLTVGALPASANVVTGAYTIGTPSGSVGSVTVVPSTVGAGVGSSFELTFTAGGTLSGPDGSWLNITPSESLGSAPVSVDLVDGSGSGCFQSGTTGEAGNGIDTPTDLIIELLSTCTIESGDKVEVDFNADAPTTTGSFSFTVNTSDNSSPGTSNTIAVGTSGATLSAASFGYGANTTYTISDVTVANLSGSSTSLTLEAAVTAGTEPITFYGGTAGYTVSYTPVGGVATADTVETATLEASGEIVLLTLATALADGDVVNITALGTNPGPSTVTQSDNVSVIPGSGSVEATNSLTFGNSVAAVTVEPSIGAAGATSSYVVSFRTSSAVSAGGYIFLSESGGPTNFSTVTGVLVADITRSWQFVATGAGLADGSADIPLQDAIYAGDYITVTLANVTNPGAGSISDFTLSTSADTVSAKASPYVIGGTGTSGVVVSVEPSSAGALATYTISDLVASAGMAGGTSTITVEGPPGTVFPNNAGYYTVEDSTTPTGSGTVSAGVSGGGTNDVAITVPDSIYAGDHLNLVIEDVDNPSTASAAYVITILGAVTGQSGSTLAPFPQANLSYPNGAIVNFSGTDYVFAGGHAFEVSSSSSLTALKKVDHATVVTAPVGATPPTASPRAGTLVFTRPITGTATIYVAGTDGDLHGFATPAQFLGDGYDPALVVTVTSVAGVTVGKTAGSEGAAANALSTSADGAIVVSSGAYYVFAGARAFGVPNPTSLATIKKADKAKALSGTVTSAQTGASVANGVLFSFGGVVYVSYGNELFPFSSLTQLTADGYSGTAAVTAAGAGGMSVVRDYSGS